MPEWTAFYLRYKSLKALLKHDQVGACDFECLLQTEIKKIEEFYVCMMKRRLDDETAQKLHKFAWENCEAVTKRTAVVARDERNVAMNYYYWLLLIVAQSFAVSIFLSLPRVTRI